MNWVEILKTGVVPDGVYFNPVEGEAGTDKPIGFPEHPVNNLADAITIMFARNTKKLILAGARTLAGTHTGATNPVVMTDSVATFAVGALIGLTINNVTDGSSGVITDNDATTVTVASLAGGTDNIWHTGDVYTVILTGSYTPLTPDLYVMTDVAASFVSGALVGLTIYDTTDGSSGVVTANTATTITCSGGLSGGTLNIWTTGDTYTVTITGSHTSANTPIIMTDANTEPFKPNLWVGWTIYNETDLSSGVITANDEQTVTVAALTGGTNNIWRRNDAYHIADASDNQPYRIVFAQGISLDLVGNGLYDVKVEPGISVDLASGLVCKFLYNKISTLNIYGDCHTTGNLYAGGNLSIFGNCQVSGYMSGDSPLTIYGDCHAGSIPNSDSAIVIFGNCQIEGDVFVATMNITVHGIFQIGGNLDNSKSVIGSIKFTNPNPVIEMISGYSATNRVVSRGSLRVTNMVGGATAVIDLCGGVLTIDSDCTGGTIDLYGDCELVNNSVSPFVTVNDHRTLKDKSTIESSATKNWKTATDSPDSVGGLVVDLGTAATLNKLHSLSLNVSALTDGANIHVKLFEKIDGSLQKIYDEIFTINTDPDGLPIVSEEMIHDVLSVAVYSDTSESKAISYTAVLEAM